MGVPNPKVSVLMSVYNGDRYVKEAINSILNQTFTNFEFIIIDDGSTDRTLEILTTYTEKDDRIRLASRENRGLTKTLNEMLSQSKGDFIARIDADDIALPERFDKQLQFLQQNTDVVCVGSSLDWIDEKGRFIAHCSMPEGNEELQQLMLGGISMLHHPCAMFRRLAALQVGGYDETLKTSADLDLWLKLGEIGRLANLPETLMLYRLHPRSITNAKQVQQSNDALAACQRAWKRRGIKGTFIRQPADHLWQYDFWLRSGWNNALSGEQAAARRCGQRAIALKPWGRSGWKLLLASLIPSRLGSKLV
jgi:glycosyltransferase involved in cell wall biosynthesis